MTDRASLGHGRGMLGRQCVKVNATCQGVKTMLSASAVNEFMTRRYDVVVTDARVAVSIRL